MSVKEKKGTYSRNRPSRNTAFDGMTRLAGNTCYLDGKELEGGKSVYFKDIKNISVGLMSYKNVLYEATYDEHKNAYILAVKRES